MSPVALCVGIDGAKATLAVAVRPTAETWQVPNDTTGLRALVERLQALAPTLVIVEATGGFEGPLLAALAVGSLAKTKRLDAGVLAHFAAAVKPVPRARPDAATQELAALRVRRRQGVERLTAERHRLGTAPPACMRPSRSTSPGWKAN